MKNKLLIWLIGLYVIAFSINLMPALKHPDLHLSILGLFVSIVFMFSLLMYCKKGSHKLRIFSLAGFLSGIIVYLITLLENRLIGVWIFNAIENLQYLLSPYLEATYYLTLVMGNILY